MKSSPTRSRSPMRSVLNRFTSSVKKPQVITKRSVSEGSAPVAVTAIIKKIKNFDGEPKQKIITMELMSANSKKLNTTLAQGERVSFSNRRCRLLFDPEASGHLRVQVLKAATFSVVSSTPGCLKILVADDQEDPDSMQSFLYKEAQVGFHFNAEFLVE